MRTTSYCTSVWNGYLVCQHNTTIQLHHNIPIYHSASIHERQNNKIKRVSQTSIQGTYYLILIDCTIRSLCEYIARIGVLAAFVDCIQIFFYYYLFVYIVQSKFSQTAIRTIVKCELRELDNVTKLSNLGSLTARTRQLSHHLCACWPFQPSGSCRTLSGSSSFDFLFILSVVKINNEIHNTTFVHIRVNHSDREHGRN